MFRASRRSNPMREPEIGRFCCTHLLEKTDNFSKIRGDSHMSMRLVRDDDETDTRLMDEQERAERRVRDKSGTIVKEVITSEQESPDGVVDDVGDDVSSPGAAEINLGVLEALLFSTHHPLTA